MKTSPSIRKRLARALLHASLLWGFAVSGAVWLALQYELHELLDETLQTTAEALSVLLPHGDARTVHEVEGNFVWQVVAPDGRVLQRSTQAPQQPFHMSSAVGLADVPGWHVFGLALRAQNAMLYVAQADSDRREAQAEVTLSAVLAALLIGWLAHGWLGRRLREELAPLQRLSARLSRHEILQPEASLGPAEREELAPVHAAVDDLARRLAERVMHERAFSGHAAHALRTPLAGIDAQLALALRESPPQLQPRLQRARDAAGRLQRVVAALLALFRTADAPHRERVDVGAMLARLPIDGLDVQVHEAVAVDADPDLLAAALLNLLDNTLRHGGQRVVVSMPSLGTLRLHDDGPGVSAERRQALQASLARQAYAGQTGLGLMLADLVARSHGGQLTLPEMAAGFAVDLAVAQTIATPALPGRSAAAPVAHSPSTGHGTAG
jgi:signal transduction histidine kinase